MPQFEITLKNEKLRQYNRIALLTSIINLAIFIYLAVSTDISSVKIPAITSGAFIILFLSIDYFQVSIKKNDSSPYGIIALFFIAGTWFKLGYWWAAVLCFILGSSYAIAKRNLLVTIANEKIVYPSFPQKNIDWSELNNIILKDGLLTINFKNNRFIQQYADETKTAVNEQEFNDFCRQQLNK